MAFSLSGDTITQSGTDNDMSGLTGIGSVQTFSTGGDTVMYIIPYKLDITGTITIKPYERLHFDRATTFFAQEIKMQAGAIWNWGEQITENSVTKDAETLPITFSNLVRNDFVNNTDTTIYTFGGTLNWRNVTIKGAGHHFYVNTVLNWTNVTIDREELSLTNDIQWRPNGGCTVNIDGFRLIRGKVFIDNNNTFTQFKGFAPIHCNVGFSARNLSAPQTIVGNSGSVNATGGFFELEDFNPIGNTKDFGAFRSNYLRLVNPAPGTDLIIGGWLDSNSISDGWIETQSDVKIIITNRSGNPVQGVKTYLVDNNTGAINPWANTETYDESSDASGEIDLRVFTGFQEIVNGNLPSMIRRSASQSDDLYTLPLASYLYDIDFVDNLNLAGNGVKVVPRTLNDDLLIVELDALTVDTYTHQENPFKAYDHLKRVWEVNYTGQTETYATRSGETLNCRAYDVVIDGTGSGAPTIIGNTITLNASLFTGNITTTGTITRINGATVKGTLTDSSGSISFATLSISGLQPNTKVFLFDTDLPNTDVNYQLDSQSISGTYTYDYEIINGNPINVKFEVVALGFKMFTQTLSLDEAGFSTSIIQQTDIVYENP